MTKQKKKLRKDLKENLNIDALEINIRKNMRLDSHGIVDIINNPRQYRKKRCFRKQDRYLSR